MEKNSDRFSFDNTLRIMYARCEESAYNEAKYYNYFQMVILFAYFNNRNSDFFSEIVITFSLLARGFVTPDV